MPKRTQWTIFLQNHKGSGKKITELSAMYREANPRPATTCNSLSKTECTANTDKCTWVQNDSKKKKTRGKRASFCRNNRIDAVERCTICGNVKQISDWTRMGCNKCLDLPEDLQKQLATTEQYRNYRDRLRTRVRYTDAEALSHLE
jgi:hypothetical protein